MTTKVHNNHNTRRIQKRASTESLVGLQYVLDNNNDDNDRTKKEYLDLIKKRKVQQENDDVEVTKTTEKSFSILSWIGNRKNSKSKEDKVLKRLKYLLHDNNDDNNNNNNNNNDTHLIMNKIQNNDVVIKTTEPFNILSWMKKLNENKVLNNNNNNNEKQEEKKRTTTSPLPYFVDTTDSASIGLTFSNDEEETSSLKRQQQMGNYQNNNDDKRLETIDGILSFRRNIDDEIMSFDQQQQNKQSNNAFQRSNEVRNNYSEQRDGILIEHPLDIENSIVNGKQNRETKKALRQQQQQSHSNRKICRILVYVAVVLIISIIILFVWIETINPSDPRLSSSSSSVSVSSSLDVTSNAVVSKFPPDSSSDDNNNNALLHDNFRSKLEPYFVDGDDEFPGSYYQQKALDWIVSEDLVSNTISELLERYVLAILYFSIKSKIDFRIPKKHVCEWDGIIYCQQQSVFAISIVGNYSISGTLLTEIGLLTNLVRLDIAGGNNNQTNGNALVGTIPSEIGKLKYLESLLLQSNNLSGTIPSELGLLTNLQQLELFDNTRIHSTIPKELGNIQSLKVLRLEQNRISGSIPSELFLFTRELEFLELSRNKLTGTIPTEIGFHQKLGFLMLYSNNLTGSIPSEIGALSHLSVLSLASNLLTSSLPTEMKKLTSLQNLYLYHNNFDESSSLDILLCDDNNIPFLQELAADCLDYALPCSCCTHCCSSKNRNENCIERTTFNNNNNGI